ncbi:MAG: alginate lyase family protein [Bacteroidetes bacterium]|nr:alginate lyase family protein [Bacteroidota bacterium]
MINYKKMSLFLIVIFISSCCYQSTFKSYYPSTIFWDSDSLLVIKEKIHENDVRYVSAYDNIIQKANSALEVGPFSVTTKENMPPSGDKHDYMSLAPYWWPDTTKKDGLPYIRRDGLRNPEYDGYDVKDFVKLKAAVKSLGLAYYFSDNEAYAEHAAKLLRVWFLDPWTKMNPNLEYAQAVKGIEEGRNFGIIETVDIGIIADISEMLTHSPSWSQNDYNELKKWFREYLIWLQNSKKGQQERDWHNNHGTWYDVQVTYLALTIGEEELAKKTLLSVPEKRITAHIKSDGSQPYELERTKSYDYSVYNLKAMMMLARLGEFVDVDLWNYKSESGANIKSAFDFLLPFVEDSSGWKYEMISPWEKPRSQMYSMLKLMSSKYANKNYLEVEERLKERFGTSDEFQLLYPPIIN